MEGSGSPFTGVHATKRIILLYRTNWAVVAGHPSEGTQRTCDPSTEGRGTAGHDETSEDIRATWDPTPSSPATPGTVGMR